MNCFHRWRKWIRPLIVTIYVMIIVIVLPLLIVELYKKDAPDHVKGWFVAGIFTLLSLPISLWGISQHLVYFTKPVLQKNIIRVLWMVPVYALNAWLALLFPPAAIYLDTIRECYEAYVIYNFMSYLLNYLHIEHPYLEYDLENKPQVKHFLPFCFLPAWPMGRTFVARCKHGVLQYTIIRPLTTVIALACEFGDKYDEGDFNFQSAWSYLVIINNISQIWAMYCLVLFYKLTKEELQPIKPVPKFMCVKAVVFLSFWQAVVIAALAKLGAIPQNGPWLFYRSVKEVATGLQDFCICIEMFFAAIAHYFSFSHIPYMDMAADRSNCCSSFMSMWDISDVHHDVMEHARFIGTGVQKRLRKKFRSPDTENKPLLSESQQPERSAQEIMEQNQRSADDRPHTPPVVVHDDFMSSVRTDWDGSSIDQRDNPINQKRGTASLNNFADFGTSLDSSTIIEKRRSSSAKSESAKSDSLKDEKLIDFDAGTSDVKSITSINADSSDMKAVGLPVDKTTFDVKSATSIDSSDMKAVLTDKTTENFEAHSDIHNKERNYDVDTVVSDNQAVPSDQLKSENQFASEQSDKSNKDIQRKDSSEENNFKLPDNVA